MGANKLYLIRATLNSMIFQQKQELKKKENGTQVW
jgi:hypothetical protein